MRRNSLAALAGMVAMLVAAPCTQSAFANRWGAGYFPDVPVVTQDGKTLHFYDDVIKGKIVVVNFIYTSCSDLCPIETARLAEVKDKLGDAVGRDIFFVSLSVDPVHDTPEALKKFADAFGASAPGWQFLTGQPDDIDAINARFGDRSAQRNLTDHRNEILIGNDSTGDWQRETAFNDIDEVAMAIHLMDPKFRAQNAAAQIHASSANGYSAIGDQQGQALFKRMCAPCHTIGGGRHVGPDLAGVGDRRDHAWLTGFIMNPAKVLARKDPDAVALAAQFPDVTMPRMGLGETDAADVLAFVRAETARLSASAQNTAAQHTVAQNTAAQKTAAQNPAASK